jgi:hypothetical protein
MMCWVRKIQRRITLVDGLRILGVDCNPRFSALFPDCAAQSTDFCPSGVTDAQSVPQHQQQQRQLTLDE